MTEQNGRDLDDLDELKNAVRHAVESGENIQAQVRELVVSALSDHPDLQRVKEVTIAVIKGIGEGAEAGGKQVAATMRKSLAGVEDALSHAGEATSLALKEAAGKAGDFASHDLKQTMDELTTLQQDYSDSLGEVLKDAARSSADTATEIVKDMQRHAHDSGSSFAERVRQNTEQLGRLIPSAAPKEAADRLYETADMIGRVAASILRCIREGLEDQASTRTTRSDGDKSPSGAADSGQPGNRGDEDTQT